jgi:hypothetical protein
VQRSLVRGYWLYRPTGRLWAVELVDGEVAAACDPLDGREASHAMLRFLPFDVRDVTWIRGHSHHFTREPWDT